MPEQSRDIELTVWNVNKKTLPKTLPTFSMDAQVKIDENRCQPSGGLWDLRVFYKSLINISHASIPHHSDRLPTIGKWCINRKFVKESLACLCLCDVCRCLVWSAFIWACMGCVSPASFFPPCDGAAGIKSNQVKLILCTTHPIPHLWWTPLMSKTRI